MLPEPPSGAQATCETAGVLGPITATIAAMQVADALIILTGHQDELSGKITVVDLWAGEVHQASQPKANPDCPACGRREFSYLAGKQRAPISLCGRNAVQIHDRARHLDLKELAARLQSVGAVKANEFALRAQIENFDLTVFPGWARHRQGHNRCRRSPQPLCKVRRQLRNRSSERGSIERLDEIQIRAVVLIAVLLSSVAPAQERLKMSTTTSTDNSGLLNVLLPPFEKECNCKVDVIAVGTGKALKLAEAGDVDVVLVHARALEDKFVADGFGVNRRDVMYNDFVVIGPAADPANLKRSRRGHRCFPAHRHNPLALPLARR